MSDPPLFAFRQLLGRRRVDQQMQYSAHGMWRRSYDIDISMPWRESTAAFRDASFAHMSNSKIVCPQSALRTIANVNI